MSRPAHVEGTLTTEAHPNTDANTQATVGAGLNQRARELTRRLGLTPRLARAACIIFLVSRLVLIAITVSALLYAHVTPTPSHMLYAWERWDSAHFHTIATSGYNTIYSAAFFPLQPLLAWLLSPLAGGNSYVSGMFVSNLAFFGALLGMAALARNDQDDSAAIRAMLLLTFYPLSFFTFAGYSESVFLFCLTWGLMAIRSQWWVAAYILGLAAGLARQVGLLLMAPYALAQYARARGRLRNLDWTALGVAGPALGIGLFCVWLWGAFGDPLAWMHAEKLWGRAFAPPWVGFEQSIIYAFAPFQVVVLQRASMIETSLALMFAVLIGVGARRLPPGETLYCIAIWLVTVCFPGPTGLISVGRLLLPLAPCFLTLAFLTKRRWAFVLLLVIFVALFAYLAQYFARGYAIL